MYQTKKILILAPPPQSSGGVASYVQALKDNWSATEQYAFRGNTGSGKIMRPLIMIRDYFSFILKCLSGNKTILVNTSMDKKAFRRDSLFMLIAVILRKRLFVFIHGWDQTYFSSLTQSHLRHLFQAVKIFVLSNEFKLELQNKGYLKEVLVETTVVDNSFISYCQNVTQTQSPACRFLYLARLEKEKGILLLLEAFQKLVIRHPDIQLDIAGFGSMAEQVKTQIEASGITNITYHGLVKGKAKAGLFGKANVYVLPTSHGEGMPISILEAMAAGLAVITTSAGALKDFFIDGKMGYKMISPTVDNLVEKMEEAIRSKERLNEIGQYNYEYSRKHFTVDKVISRLEKEILH